MTSRLFSLRTRPVRVLLVTAAISLLATAFAISATTTPADAADDELGLEVIQTFAGTGEAGYSGDGGPAVEAQLRPSDVAVNEDGHTYIAEGTNNRVRKVGPSESITTIAGTGHSGPPFYVGGFSGDGGPATQAELNVPSGVATAQNGTLYIADSLNHRIRKVDPSGVISTVAGSGETGFFGGGFGGDGGAATEALLHSPSDVALGQDGSLFIADQDNHRIRKVDLEGVITTVAGTGEAGFGGDGGQATEAELDEPAGIAADAAGNLYIADLGNNRVRKVDASSGIITTVAGTGEAGFSGDGGPATEADLDRPNEVLIEDGTMYVAAVGNGRVRKVDTEGTITTLAGGGDIRDGFDVGVPPAEASLRSVGGLAMHPDLGLLITGINADQVWQFAHVPDPTAMTDFGASSNPVRVGEELTYTAKVANHGLAGDASGVTVTLSLPAEAEFTSADPSQGNCSEGDATITCELGALGEGATATVPVTVTPTAPVIFRDVEASVAADGDDPYSRNNAASVTTVVADARCGDVLTEDTTLKSDVGPCPNDGLIAGTDGITIDLNGHDVVGWRGYGGFSYPDYDRQARHPEKEGLATLNNGDEVGVRVVDRHDITVENGGVTGFSAGVALVQGSSGNTVQNLTVHDNVSPHPFTTGLQLGDGIYVYNSPDNVIADNTLTRNGYYDNIGVWGPDSDGNEITGNVVEDSPPTTIGSAVFGQGIIVNGASGHGAGTTITGTQIANNTVRDQRSHGISNANSFDARIVNNRVVHNGFPSHQGGRGIGVSTGEELRQADANVTVVNNEVHDNRYDGLHIFAQGNKIINNTATNNGRHKDGAEAGEEYFDLRDFNEGCGSNVWNNNEWGSAGYNQECVVGRGGGPEGKPDGGSQGAQNRAGPARSGPPADSQVPSRPVPDFVTPGDSD